MAAEENTGLRGIFTRFKKDFWVVNAFELFERGAYYGTMSVLGVHVTYYLLRDNPSAAVVWGALYSMLIVLLYFIPLVSAALAEKYGYKNVLIVCFSLMLVGYLTLSMVGPGNFALLVVSFIIIGVGAGAFKPVISATIAHVTEEKNRNLAYSIYYWIINLGATVVPFSIGLYAFFTFGGITEADVARTGIYYFVGIYSAVLIIINTVILFTLFRNPIEPKKDVSIGKAFLRIVPAFKDKKFVVLLIIYSGFWFMFAYNHTFLPVYMVDFARMPSWFALPFLQTINPLTIIILGPFLGKLVEKYKSMNIMMTGIIIFCIGLAINGFSNIPGLFILGIFIFSIGEFITHPGFISYVSKIAPKDKITIYMGCVFISTGLGNAVGGIVHGYWYNYFGREQFMPQVYISLVIVVGFITLICFMLYNRWITGEQILLKPDTKPDRSIWTKPITAGIVIMFIPITVYGAFMGGTSPFYGDEVDETVTIIDWDEDYDVLPVILDAESDYMSENTEQEIPLDIQDKNVKSVTLILTWTDEDSQYFQGTNAPDEFSISVKPPNGTEQTSGIQTNGRISLTVEIDTWNYIKKEYYNGTGQYDVTVSCHNCGDDSAFVPLLGLRTTPDDGNAYTLEISYEYFQKKT